MKVNSFNNVFYFCIFIQLIGVASINHSNGGEFRSEDDIVKIFPKKDLNSSKKRFRTNEETVSKHWNGHSNQRIIRQSFLDLSQVIHSYRESLPDTLQVQIFEDEEPISFQKQFERSDDRGFYWNGENSDFDSSFSIQVHGPDCMGTASIGEKQYSFSTLIKDNEEDSVAAVMELDVTSFPDYRDNEDEVEIINRDGRMKGNSNKSKRKNAFGSKVKSEKHHERLTQAQETNSDDGSVVDVLCLYTKEALEAKCESLNGKDCSKRYSAFINNMNYECQFAANQATNAYKLSGVATSINLVHSTLVDPTYVEEENICNIKNKMRYGSSSHPMFRQAQNLREQYQADLVGLITSNRRDYCGCGSQPNSWNFDTSDYAYFTATEECATDNFSFAHEIGHAFGCFHNSWNYGHPFANGYRDPKNGFRTIMSYSCEGVRCRRVLRISSSDTKYKFNGHPIGDERHDNARQINQRRFRIANYRKSLTVQNVETPSPSSSPTTPNAWSCIDEEFYLDKKSRKSRCRDLNNLKWKKRDKVCKKGTALLDCKLHCAGMCLFPPTPSPTVSVQSPPTLSPNKEIVPTGHPTIGPTSSKTCFNEVTYVDKKGKTKTCSSLKKSDEKKRLKKCKEGTASSSCKLHCEGLCL